MSRKIDHLWGALIRAHYIIEKLEIKLNGIEIHIVLKMNVYVVRGLNESNLKLTHFIKKFCQTQRKFLKNVSILRALIWASYIIEIYFQCKMMLNAILVASKEFH